MATTNDQKYAPKPGERLPMKPETDSEGRLPNDPNFGASKDPNQKGGKNDPAKTGRPARPDENLSSQ